MRILIVEDDAALSSFIKKGLEAEHHAVDVANEGNQGRAMAMEFDYDLVVLDLNLPGVDGLSVLKSLRQRKANLPVMILTARSRIEDRVQCLDSGADDYLVKPFAFPELLARLRVLLRRGKQPDAGQRLTLADLEMDVSQRWVMRGGQQVELTVREFDLLQYLFANQGRVVSREMLARDIWKETARQTPLDNVIDAQVVRLRRKLDGQFERKLLHTVRGVGFILREQNEP